ncbi:MAG: LPXTG cell wall anchor domain-containing protein [Clostridia bacterium]|nr:LPXTG cell wall anchor domain-containing protein [Clostridia bacterium]
MKKTAAILIAVSFIFGMFAISANADTTADVYVTIANGDLKIAMEKVSVSDIDGDGIISVNDALYAAHEKYYEGGASAGYSAVQSDWGLSLAKLWGVENGGSYGYMINDSMAMSLSDELKNGDHLYAYVFTDTVGWSDSYSFFDIKTVDILEGKTVTLTLSASGFDENWAPVVLPLAGAVITLNGEKTSFVTDENGKANVTLEKNGEYIISAVSDSMTLVPPVALAIARPALLSGNPSTDDADTVVFVAMAILALAGAAMLIKSRRYEK